MDEHFEKLRIKLAHCYGHHFTAPEKIQVAFFFTFSYFHSAFQTTPVKIESHFIIIRIKYFLKEKLVFFVFLRTNIMWLKMIWWKSDASKMYQKKVMLIRWNTGSTTVCKKTAQKYDFIIISNCGIIKNNISKRIQIFRKIFCQPAEKDTNLFRVWGLQLL